MLVSDMYYDWLKEFVRTDNSENYNELLGHLYYRTYIWMLPNDENRAADGLSLRNRFEYETGIRVGIGNCSVLEMLIALANRIENEIMGDPVREDITWYWFWTFIDNLGLIDCSDDCFDEVEVDQKLDIWMTNMYSEDGEGSIFGSISCATFFGKSDTNVKKMEIWNQMQIFLSQFCGQSA